MTAMATQEPTDPLVLYHHTNNEKSDSAIISSATISSGGAVGDMTTTAGLDMPTATEHSENLASAALSSAEAGMNKLHHRNSSNNNHTSVPPHAQYTPPRSSYAMDPNLTPIASAAQYSKTGSNTAKKNRTSFGAATSSTPSAMMLSTPLRSSSSSSLTSPNTSTPLSEMKRVQQVVPVVRRGGGGVTCGSSITTTAVDSSSVADQVDALFSPVAQFLHDNAAPMAAHGEAGGLATIASMDELDDDAHENDDDDDDGSMAPPEVDADEDQDKFNPWLFIASLPKYENVVPVGHQPAPLLPPLSSTSFPVSRNNSSSSSTPGGQQRKTLVLDLDETLVHCKVETVDNPDFCFDVPFNGQNYCVNVKCRPHLEEFLQVVSTKFEVVVFTASQKVYAEKLLNILDPEGLYIHHRLYRDACLSVDGNYLKDLNVLGRDLTQTVLVDNSPHAFGYQVDNGIPIESWWDDPLDKELKKLKRFLMQKVVPATDVRTVVRNKFQSHILVSDAGAMTGHSY